MYTETVRPAPERASDRAYRVLRDEILDGLLPAGTVLLEVEQSARLGVSRTPLRAAVARLVADGLVAGRSGRGFSVTEMSVDSINDLYELREALEERAATLAARGADRSAFRALRERFLAAPALLEAGEHGIHEYYALIDEFDAAIDDAIGNSFLVGALDTVRTHLVRIRRVARGNPVRLRAAAAEHLLILDAIIDGDAALAAHATHVHLHLSRASVLAMLGANEPAS
ncbi:GntR family transcriptional regulator [Cryobacterium arcticum]|uniref:GntR family transcriptional regulator n=1 Tax=Cryobacterium arcticum TaxID=670052 RepID=UPI002007077F|nr:GntR family transcriptional regulator [Cryobacterium arcticum]